MGSEAPWRGKRNHPPIVDKSTCHELARRRRATVIFSISCSISDRGRRCRSADPCVATLEIARRGNLTSHAQLGRGAARSRSPNGTGSTPPVPRSAPSPSERQQAILGQHRRCRLEQKALVGGAAALAMNMNLLIVIAFGVDLALRRHVCWRFFSSYIDSGATANNEPNYGRR